MALILLFSMEEGAESRHGRGLKKEEQTIGYAL